MSDASPFHEFQVSPDEAGARFDRALTDGLNRAGLGPVSRARVKALIEAGEARLDGATITDPSHRVKPGMRLGLRLPAPEDATPAPQAMALDIVYEDDDVIVIDKPPGLVVHPGPGTPDQTLVNALIAHCGDSLSGINGVKRPGIVHRIDKDTSGLLVVAKNDLAHQGLAAQFADHSLERVYTALVWGGPEIATGRIEGAIGRDARDRKKRALRATGGKHAVTHYKRLAWLAGRRFSLMECRLETGRTHQIRVHMTAKGWPLVGDPVYGRGRGLGGLSPAAQAALRHFNRQALHAGVLGFEHPRSGEFLRFQSPLPPDMAGLISLLEKEESHA